jgi:hypothetical protein
VALHEGNHIAFGISRMLFDDYTSLKAGVLPSP